MTIETYQELFCYTAVPVFVTERSTGKIVYKNSACVKFLSKLNGKKFLKLSSFSPDFQGIGPVKLVGFGLYHTAVVLGDGERSVFIFLSYLQYEAGIVHAGDLFRRFGPSLTDFLCAAKIGKNEEISKLRFLDTDPGLYTETLELLIDEKSSLTSSKTSLYQLAERVFPKLNSGFSEFGYCVNTKISDDFPRYLRTAVSVQEILFILGRLLYLQMKLSTSKEANVLLSCDFAFSRHVFHITAGTALLELPTELSEEWFWKVVPECAMEFSLLLKTGLLNQENFEMKLDSFGNLTVLYRVPYTSPETYYVRSLDADDRYLCDSIDRMMNSLLVMLTNSGASC